MGHRRRIMKMASKEKAQLKKGSWSPEEDHKLIAQIRSYGIWNWNQMPKAAGLARSGKSCRLRWMNYLRPNIKRGKFTKEEDETIFRLRAVWGNRWSAIAAKLSGRTDNDIKNHWHTHLKKRLNLMVTTNNATETFTSDTILEANLTHFSDTQKESNLLNASSGCFCSSSSTGFENQQKIEANAGGLSKTTGEHYDNHLCEESKSMEVSNSAESMWGLFSGETGDVMVLPDHMEWLQDPILSYLKLQ